MSLHLLTREISPSIITVASSKGGVGKSTISICLAGAYAKTGANVHIVDLDENRTVQRWFSKHRISIPNLSVSAVSPSDFPSHLKEVITTSPDYILIDVAGVYEKALLQAMGRSSLVIIPAQPSEPDIHEATKIVRDLTDLNENFHGNVPYRLLLNLFEPLDPLYQRHVVGEVARLQLHRFDNVMHKRSPYREAFMSGAPPHFADPARDAVAKAILEVDQIIEEIKSVLVARTTKEVAA